MKKNTIPRTKNDEDTNEPKNDSYTYNTMCQKYK